MNMKTSFTKAEAEELMKQSDFINQLRPTEILKLIWWDFFNTKKRNVFLSGLHDGKNTKSAFKDASNSK